MSLASQGVQELASSIMSRASLGRLRSISFFVFCLWGVAPIFGSFAYKSPPSESEKVVDNKQDTFKNVPSFDLVLVEVDP